MSENNNDQLNGNSIQQSSAVDFVKMYKDLLKHRKLYYKVLPIAFVLAAVYALAIPNFYKCTVKLSPDVAGQQFWF